MLRLERRASHAGMVSVGGNLYRDTNASAHLRRSRCLADEVRIFEDGALVATRAPLEGRARSGSILRTANRAALAAASLRDEPRTPLAPATVFFVARSTFTRAIAVSCTTPATTISPSIGPRREGDAKLDDVFVIVDTNRHAGLETFSLWIVEDIAGSSQAYIYQSQGI